MMARRDEIIELLRRSGCAAAGFAKADPLTIEVADLYHRWLEDGCHAGMEYLVAHESLRRYPANVLENVRTVISIAFRYSRPDSDSLSVAAYALGRDYHKALKARLRPLCAFLEDVCNATTRICVDSAPLPERFWAERSGIAVRASNGAVCVPGCGPSVFLCEVLVSIDISDFAPYFAVEGEMTLCNGCGACVAACPTGALLSNGTVDSRRCLSYLSIEHRGELPKNLQLNNGTRFPLFGCDRCVAVCPMNEVRHPAPMISDFEPRRELVQLTPESVLTMTDDEIDRFTRGTAMRRCGVEGLKRNARKALQ